MDAQQLKELIKQVAEIKERKPTVNPSIRPAMETVIEIDEDGEEIEVERRIEENPTLGFELIKIKPVERMCQLGCGDIVADQVIERRFAEFPKAHWKTRCKNCGCYLTPDGLGFVDNSSTIQQMYIKHFRDQDAVSKVNPQNPNIETKIYAKDKDSRWSVDSQGNITLKG
jgi:hypothetical protein